MHASINSEDPTVMPTPIPNDSTQGAARDPDAAAADECQLMAELSIIRDGRQYLYDGYCYDRLSDALAYAQRVRGQARPPGPSSPAQSELVDSPTAFDRELMTELSISFENGRFVFAGFHYDRLADAASYARDHRPDGARQ
jgi:hypothetical protein